MKKFIDKYGLLIIILLLLLVVLGISIVNTVTTNILNIIILFIIAVSSIVVNIIFNYNKYKRFDVPLITFFIFVLISLIFKLSFKNILVVIMFLFFLVSFTVISLYFKYNSIKSPKICKLFNISKKWYVVLNIMFPLFTLLILENYYRICTFQDIYTPTHIQSFIFALFLIAIIYTLFLFVSGSTFKANIILSVLLIIIFIVNQIRIFYTNDTLMLTDVMFLSTGGGGEIGQLMDATLINAITYLLLPTLIVLVFIIWQTFISRKYDIRIRGFKRIYVSIAASIILAILFVPIAKLDREILNVFYNTSDPKDYAIAVSNTRYYKRFGVLSGMYGKYLEFERYRPSGYDEKDLKNVLDNAPKNNGTWGNPNVIVVFSESFWDVTRINGITFDKDVISNFHSLKDKGHLFEMITPSYGGISANVEFEILTGGSLDYFGKGYIPYMQLYTSEKSANNPSIIREFNNNGYVTKILNASSSTMFNCEKVYSLMDVSERRHIYDEGKSINGYVRDEYITDQIIKEFSNKDSKEKLFYMAITMGAHMPYYPDKYSKYDIGITNSVYDLDTTGTILSYAQGIYDADRELGRLYDYINTLDEDTIVVFFGDHLPFIQNKNGEDSLEKVGYFNHSDNLKSVYNRFNTEALILSNYDIKFDNTKYISPDMLLTYVINNMDLSISPYYSWLYSTKDTFGSSNHVVTQTRDGKIHYTMGLNDETKEVFDMREKVQHWLFN